MDTIDRYIDRLRADQKPLCDPRLERRIAQQDAYLEFAREMTRNAGEDPGTVRAVLDDLPDDFIKEFMAAFRLYGSQHLTNEKAAEFLTGMLESYDSELGKYIEHEWKKDNG